MSAISKRAPKKETAATNESNKRRLKRLLRQLFRSELSAYLKTTITRDEKTPSYRRIIE